ncbi:MAG: LuxR C-terminal-related transcriptional regulator [Gammaproteobacteria bacterium]|nr:LuxR C-terminal-related transcriptional regulator [Gammaproteobacteria bacterium]
MVTSQSWHWAGKVTPPQRTPFHLERKNLLEEAEKNHWSVVAVTAPSGFGKTTLLAELCRRARRRNEIAGWLTVDEDDNVESIASYIELALEQAGFAIAGSRSGHAGHLLRIADSIESDGRPCLLAIDELENLHGAAVVSLNEVLQRAPSNLRFMFGMRQNPGLDLSRAVLNGRALEYDEEQLRFSGAEVSAYFNDALSRREHANLVESTQGWAVALSLSRFEQSKQLNRFPAEDHARVHEIATDWITHRLLRSISRQDYEFLLELAQFDWIEPSIVNEALDRTDTANRLGNLQWLNGLSQPMDSPVETMRLNPLIKAHGEQELKRTDLDRYRELHRAIGTAMSSRGHVAAALRHANIAEDEALLAHVLLGAGGLGWLLQEGMVRLGNTLDLLSDSVTDRYPRLAMLKCRALVYRSKLTEALVLFERTRLQTANFSQDEPASGDEGLLRYESTYIHGILVGFGALPLNSEFVDELVTSHVLIRGDDRVPSALVAGHAVLSFGFYQSMGMFEQAREFAEEGEAIFKRIDSHHGEFHIQLNLGMVDLARGDPAEAERRYGSAADILERHLDGDRRLRQLVDTLVGECHLECNRLGSLQQLVPRIPVPFRNGAAWFSILAAANEVIVEWKYESGGAEAALGVLDVLQESTRSGNLAAASRHLAALRVGHLAMDGRVDDAQRRWVEDRLPERTENLLRSREMNWRETEALVCARLRLLTASGQIRTAQRLSRTTLALAQQQGLVRFRMRCLALSIVLEHMAGDSSAARMHLFDYLRGMSATGFARPMVREAAAGRVLRDVLDGARIDAETREAIEALKRQIAERTEPSTPDFNRREREILELLVQGLRDKQIARELSLSVHGVRYHLKNIYRKTGAAGRAEAVNWAVSRGVLR